MSLPARDQEHFAGSVIACQRRRASMTAITSVAVASAYAFGDRSQELETVIAKAAPDIRRLSS